MLKGFAMSLAVALTLLAPATAMSADEPAHSAAALPVGGALTLRDAIGRALDANPKLQGQRFGRDAADARQDAAGFRPPVEIGLDVENIAGTGRMRAVGDAEITLRIGTVLELGDKRGRRVDLARGERGLLLTEQDAERLDVLAEVARRFVAVAAGQEILSLAQRQQALAERALEATRARARVAKAAPAEVARAEVALVQARLATDDAGHELLSARISLAAAWDAREPDFGLASADFYAVPATAPFAELAAQLDRNPDLARFASEARVLEAQAKLAGTRASPDLRLGLGVRRLEALDGQALILSLSMPFASGARAAPAIREARASIGQAGLRERSARAELYRTLFALNEELGHAREVVTTLKGEVIPLSQKVLDETEQGFRAGRFSLIELADARRQRIEAERAMIDAAQTFHRLVIETERLTGRSLGPEN